MPKISQLPQDATPTTSDYVPGVQASVPGTVRFLMSALINLFWTLANIPSGGTSPITRDNESQLAFVTSGMVWTADAAGSTKNASMTAGICYINGRRISIAAVTARTFTASDDNYIDVLDNGDGTGTLVYSVVANNAASPALAANSLRIGIIVVGATNIAAASSINQGDPQASTPTISSNVIAVQDSIGNLICPRDPANKVLGYRQILSSYNTTATSANAVPGLSCPVLIPPGRKVRIIEQSGGITNNTASTYGFPEVFDTSTSNKLAGNTFRNVTGDAADQAGAHIEAEQLPAWVNGVKTAKTYLGGFHCSGGTGTFGADAVGSEHGPAFIRIELD